MCEPERRISQITPSKMPAIAYSIFSSVISLLIILVLVQAFVWWNTPSTGTKYIPPKPKEQDYYEDISHEVAKVAKKTPVDNIRELYDAREGSRADCNEPSCFLHGGYLSQHQCLSEAERIDGEIQAWNHKHRDFKPGVGYVSWKAGEKKARPQCLILSEDATVQAGERDWTTFTRVSLEENVPRF